jgi:dipeptidyl aminopeptidase/acylaminoacyl peptidase
MTDLGDRLRGVDVPGAGAAQERGWRVVRAAAAQARQEDALADDRGAARARRRAAVRRRLPRPAAVAAAAFAALAVLAATPPGGAVADWMRDRLGRDAPPARVPARETLGSLPGGGRLLVESPAGVWLVQPDGSRRLLGRYDDATWSPQGRFVAATNPDGLFAVAPGGQVHWALARRGAESPRWSPSGFRVAYRAGGTLRVVAGDGTGDKPLARDLAVAPPAWRPVFKLHALAAADRRGRVVLVDADSGARLWRTAPGDRPLSLAWSDDGQRLLAVTRRSLRLFDPGDGRELARRDLPPGAVAGAVAFAPGRDTFALVRRLPRAGVDEVVLMRANRDLAAVRPTAPGRPSTGDPIVFRGAGRLGNLAWSPDGRWLGIAWPTADQWLFVKPGPRPQVRAAGDIARQFDPGARGPAAPPSLAGWCCS